MDESPTRVAIGEKLREDALGAWHRARQGERSLTLRILREDLAGREDARRLFEEELRRVERLDHPALLRVHAVGRRAPRPWMLTDPLHGPTLEEHVLRAGPLPADEALALVRAVHGAFRYLATRRLVHQVPLPSRFVRVGAAWRLETFGDVRAVDELDRLSRRKDPQPGWSPPERRRDHPEPLRLEPFLAWSLGALLRFSACGRRPDEPLPEGAGEHLLGAFATLLAPDPARRPAGEPAVERALAGEGRGHGGEAAGRPAAPVRRRRPDRGK